MARIKVDITQFAKEWKKRDPAISGAIHKGLVSGVLRGQAHVVQKSPVDTGLYQSSWDTRIIDLGHVQLGNSAPHAPIIEFGARPHTPPIGPLLRWAKRKLKAPGPPYPPEVWALAKGVQNKIAQFGQEPKRVLTDSLPQIKKMTLEEILKELDKL